MRAVSAVWLIARQAPPSNIIYRKEWLPYEYSFLRLRKPGLPGP